MNEREQLILKAIIKHYLEFGESVGSRTLEKKYSIGVSSATIRNTMADLEDKGLIAKTHTSSGRIPTSEGYKLYVEELIKIRDISTEAKAKVVEAYNKKMNQIDMIFEETSRLLSKISKYAGVVLEPTIRQEGIRKVQLVHINDTNIQPFKSCSAIGICQPALIGTWEKNTDVKVRDKPALLDISTIQCMHGGIISIDDAGQKEVGTAVTKTEEVKEAERDADCQYKLLINICSDINNNFMQTQLKKEAQKYAKWKKYKVGVMDNMRSYFAKDVKNMLGMRKLSESEKKNKENFIKKNKAKMQIANQEVTPEKEKYLRKKIYAVFKEAYKSVKQKSGPKFDTKGVIKNHGLSLCDYERKNFYSAKMLPVITYGYLMRAGNLTITENAKKLIESELNSDINTTNTGQIKLQNYKIQNNVKQAKEVPKQRIKSSDVSNWIGIGKMLYTSTKHAPTAGDVLNAIRKNGRSVAVCPFSQGVWDETHGSSSRISANNSVDKKVENSSEIKINGNESKNLQNNTQTIKSGLDKAPDIKPAGQKNNVKGKNNISNISTSKQIRTLNPKESEKKNCSTCPHENQKLDCRDTWDKVTNERIEKLDPRIRCTVKHLINFMEDKYKIRMRVTDGYRSHAQQNELYKKGRTTKGPVVTWVKAGYSYHNYGLAIDVCTIENGKAYWREKDYKLFNNEAVKFGAEWGIKFKDKPHFQFRFGKTASQHYQDYKNRGNKLSYML